MSMHRLQYTQDQLGSCRPFFIRFFFTLAMYPSIYQPLEAAKDYAV